MALKLPFKVNKWVLMAEAASTAFCIYQVVEIFGTSKTRTVGLASSKSGLSKPSPKTPTQPKPKTGPAYDPIALQSVKNNSISSATSKPEAQPKYTYSEDSTFVNSLWKNSMGWKFRDYVILAPKNDQAWHRKAAKIKEMVRRRRNKTIWNHWNKEYLKESQINGDRIHALCTSILYENDYGIWFTHLGKWNNRSFFDFAWRWCGRDDKTKPAGWRFSEKW